MSIPSQSGQSRKPVHEKPVHEIKLSRIRASIWANGGQGKKTWYSVAISRTYRDGDVWKETTSFNRDDLPIVSKASEMAYAWIWNTLIQNAERKSIQERHDAE